ncbi:MAG: hypothetical protein WA152_02600 [Microgenomates group bacterium]
MKQKKTVVILIITVLVLVVFGVIYFNSNKDNSSDSIENKSVFTSIKDALSKNVTLVCEFKDDSGVSTKSYIKNGAVRISSEGEIIMKDKKMYMWDVKTKQGFIYTIPDEEGDDIGATATEINQSESYLNMIETYKDLCKVASVEDTYFELPKDVNFQDMSKLLEDFKKQMPQGYELPNQ